MSALSEYIVLLNELNLTRQKIEEIKPKAIQESLDLLQNSGGKTFAFEDSKVTVRFKSRKPRPQDDPESEYLYNCLQEKRDALYKKNQPLIDEHMTIAHQSQQIAVALQEDDETIKLFNEQETFLACRTVQEPELIIKAN